VGYDGAVVWMFGSTWQSRVSGTSATLRGVSFVDIHNGWAVGDSGTVLHTTNAGSTWLPENSGTTRTLMSVRFTDINHGWAVGENGTILHYTSGEWISSEPGGLPTQIRIVEAYPNPFNATTTIMFDLHKAGHVSLHVLDLLGREVAVLTDGFFEAGSQRVTFDGSNLASGVYFARLNDGQYSLTKKLMLLK
jgi:hypothetical protein